MCPSCTCHDFSALDEESPRSTSDKQRYYLDKAARSAIKSQMAHRHGSIVVLNGEIISEGFNHAFTHMCHKYSIHAEADALYKVKPIRHLLQEAEMYVVRIAPAKFGGCYKYSKPCIECQEVIKKYGIKKVFYSTNTEYEALWKSENNKR